MCSFCCCHATSSSSCLCAAACSLASHRCLLRAAWTCSAALGVAGNQGCITWHAVGPGCAAMMMRGVVGCVQGLCVLVSFIIQRWPSKPAGIVENVFVAVGWLCMLLLLNESPAALYVAPQKHMQVVGAVLVRIFSIAQCFRPTCLLIQHAVSPSCAG
ncbi:hypothetical protein COO60DRAFT_1180195 [Scenedesmus sp. NREL 46B-D3]|nr:hypothetical protein COO60DRAFT_1180195 [Scenedesmus sp. NREL 46B-D3]